MRGVETLVMIKCVCLVVESDDKLLLVQARNRNKYYFPGGKIDSGESLNKLYEENYKRNYSWIFRKKPLHIWVKL